MRVRRALGIAGKVVGGLVAVVVAAAVILLIIAHTAWGRRRIRSRIEVAASRKINGQVQIGKLGGSVLSSLTLHNVRIVGSGGKTVVSVQSMSVSYNPLALARRQLSVSDLTVSGVRLHLWKTRSGKLNLAALTPPKKVGKPSAWTVDVRHLVVEGGTVTYRTRAGKVHALRQVAMTARVHIAPPNAQIQVSDLTGLLANQNLAVSASGTFVADSERLGVRRAALRVGASELQILTASLARSTGVASATVAADIRARDLLRLAPGLAWRGGVRLAGTLSRASAAAPWSAALRGNAAGAGLTLSAKIAPQGPRVDATLAVTGLDPHALVQSWPAGTIAGHLKASMTGTRLRSATGSFAIAAAGKLAGVRIRRLRANGRLAAGTLDATTDVATAAGTAAGRATVALAGARPVVESAHVRADVTHPEQIPGLRPPLHGTLHAELDAHGPIGDLTAAGSITGANLAFRDMRADTLSAQVAAEGIGGLPAGTLTAVAEGAVYQGTSLGRVRAHVALHRRGEQVAGRFEVRSGGARFSASGQVVIARQRGALHVAIRNLEIHLPKLAWSGGGRFVVGPGAAVTAERFALASTAGTLRVSGRLWPLSAVRASVSVAGLDLKAATDGLPIQLPPLRGIVDARGTVTAKPLAFRVYAAATGVAWRRNQPPVSVSLRASLAGRRLRGSASAESRRIGRVTAEIDVHAPARPLSARAWQKLGAGSVHALHVAVQGVRIGPAGGIAGLTALTGRGAGAAGVTGTLSGTLAYRGATDALAADFHLRGARVERLRATVAADVSARGTRDRVEAEATADLGGARVLTAQGRLGAGVASLLAHIRRGNLGAVPARATASASDVDIGAVARVLEVPGPMRGRLNASADVTGTLGRPSAQLRASLPGATIDGVLFATVDATATLRGGHYTAALSARQALGGTIAAHAEGALSPASLRTTVELTAFQLDFATPLLRRAAGPIIAVGGAASGRFAFAVGAGAGQIGGHLRLQDGTLALRRNLEPLRGIDASLSVAAGRATVTASARSGGGTLEVEATGQITGLIPDRFRASVRAHELPFIAAGTRLQSSAVATVNGTHRVDLWHMVVRVQSGTLRLPAKMGGKLYDTGALDGVIYVGGRGTRSLTSMVRTFQVPPGPALRVQVIAPSFQVRGTENLSAAMKANLDATFLGGHLYVSGDVSVVNGHIQLFGRRYQIVRAHAAFDGSSPPNPALQARLVHSFSELALYVDLSGTLDKPHVQFSSDPPTYSRAELFGFFLGGEPGTITPAPGAGTTTAASAVIAGVLRTVLNRSLPISEVKVGPGRAGAAGPSYVTVGTWVTSNVFLAYRRRFELANLPGQSTNEAVAQFRISDRWRIVGSLGTAGTGSVDVIWIRRFLRRKNNAASGAGGTGTGASSAQPPSSGSGVDAH